MRITWRDGVSTLAVAGAVVLERAYSLEWSTATLVADTRWALGGVAALAVIAFVFSYMLDATRSTLWSVVAGVLAVVAIALTALGLIYAESGYVVWLMLTAVVFWVASIVRHLTVPATPPIAGHV